MIKIHKMINLYRKKKTNISIKYKLQRNNFKKTEKVYMQLMHISYKKH